MDTSILNSIKKLLGIPKEDQSFDTDIIMNVNAVFPTLTQIGMGPEEGFMIFDDTATWSDYTYDDYMLNNVIMYVYIKTKIGFDPPTSSITLEALKATAKEYEWRIQLYVDNPDANKDTLDTIVCGTNDPIVLNIEADAKTIVDASALLRKGNNVLKTWSFSDFEFGESEIILPLTEDDTMQLSPGIITLETKWKTEDGNIDVGTDVKIRVIGHKDTTRFD